MKKIENDKQNQSISENFDSSEYERKNIYHNDIKYVEKQGLQTWLILGVDKYKEQIDDLENNENTQADFPFVLVIDKYNKQFSTIQINRDTMVEMDVIALDGRLSGTVEGQLTLAYTYGTDEKSSSLNVSRAVSRLLYGQKIDKYLTVTLDCVPILTDAVGGVTLEILDDFTDVDSTMKKGETLTLNGTQALSYIKKRHYIGDGTNLERMERQKQFLTAFEQAFNIKTAVNSNFALDAMGLIEDYFFTNASAQTLQNLQTVYNEYENLGNFTLDGEAVLGEKFIEYYPDENTLKELALKIFYEKGEEWEGY